MLITIIVIQFTVFSFFFTLERLIPAHTINRPKSFGLVWVAVNAFALVWANAGMYYYLSLDGVFDLGLGPVASGFFYYMVYSFTAYWYHRVRHSNFYLWQFIHKFHHSTPQMETIVAFYKHPTEYMLNSIVVLTLAWLFSMPIEAIVLALAIEGCLECFHHSNIKIAKKYDWIGWIIQTPKMHLIHHQYGCHRYNYATFLWDTVFGTARVSTKWNGRLGFDSSFDTYNHVLLKK